VTNSTEGDGMEVGVNKVICTCGEEMTRTGGVWGGEITSSTYYCYHCQKHVVVVTPKEEDQKEFVQELKLRR
jgi:hypothetical protein